MASVEYDLDCSGGLMEQIQKLVAPPESDLPQRKRRTREYRRQGRSVNHDCCDSCKEGGDLICCDRCPAAFHMQCHDPPLEDEDVPPGEWLCHRCKVSPPPPPEPKEDEDAMSTCSSHSRKSGSSSLRRQVVSWQRSHTSSPSIIDMDVPMPSDSDDEDEPTHPLLKLAKAARMMNPKQMVLAKEVGCAFQLPGSSKRKLPYRDGRWGSKKQAHELDNGMVPLPAKLCFLCSKSCRKGTLIQCDYCPLLFHMDCLDPPVPSLPSGRWMCPNHVEHTLDEKLLKSVRLSDRIKLWDKYTGPVNHHAVKIQFMNKIHRKNPPFRYKVQHRREKRISVPAAIKAQYAQRAPLLKRAPDTEQVGADIISGSLPSSSHITSQEEQEEWLLSVVGLQTNIARHLAQQQLNKDLPLSSSLTASTTSKPTASVQPVKQERPETPVSIATVYPMSGSSKDADSKPGVTNGSLSGANSQDMLGNGPLSATVASATVKPNGPVSLLQPGSTNAPCTANGDLDVLKASDLLKGSGHKVVTTGPGQSVVKLTVPCTPGSTGGAQSRNIVISTVNKTTGAVGSKVVTASPAPAGKVVVNTAAAAATAATSKNLPGTNSTSLLSPRIATTGKVATSTSGKVTVVSGTPNTSGSKVITVTTPAQAKSAAGSLQTKTVTPASLSSSPAIINLNNTLQACVDGTGEVELGKLDERLVQILAWQRLQQLLPQKSTQTQQQPKKAAPSTLSIHSVGSTEVRARSLLCPLTGKGQPVPMPYRSLTIGTGGDMDVCLIQFGHCNFVSPKHACIFYDETTRHYELLNYSEHGTTVDNVLYSCDFSEKTVSAPQPTNVVHSVRKLIAKSRGKEEAPESPTKPFMCAHSNEVRHTCSCKASSSSLIGGSGAGWEGTALLHHGSYIKVGCLQFVFSIVEQAVRDPCIDKKPAGTSLLKATLRSPSFSS